MSSKAGRIFAWITMLVAVAGAYLVFLLPQHDVEVLADEDGLIESFGAAAFLIASILFGFAFAYSRNSPAPIDRSVAPGRRNLFLLALSAAFLFAFLEEISWGQRMFGFDTPEFFVEGNRQREINIHNLKPFHGLDEQGRRKSFWKLLLNADRMFSLFWVSLCVIAPVMAKLSARARALLTRIRFPVLPIGFGALFVLNYMISRAVATGLPQVQHAAVELKETICAFLFFCASAWVLNRIATERKRSVATRPQRCLPVSADHDATDSMVHPKTVGDAAR